MAIKSHIRSLVLPVAMLLALLFHGFFSQLYVLAPYLVFTMLFISYTAIDVHQMRPKRMDFWLMAFQVAFAIASYLLGRLFFRGNDVLADGLLVTALTPVAASSVVVSCALGAKRETVTTFTILNNLMVAVVAPVIFAFIGQQDPTHIFLNMWVIFRRICPQIVFPFFAALLLQRFLPRINAAISSRKSATLYIWAFTLTVVLGKTFHDIVVSPDKHWGLMAAMFALCVAQCAILFWVGKKIGERHGDKMAGGQELGQKNTSFGIWMSVEFLNPLAALSMAFYSICQNLFNSWQMYQHDKKHLPET